MKMKITAYVTEFEGDVILQIRMRNEVYHAPEGVKIHFSISDHFEDGDIEALNKIGKMAYDKAKEKGLKVNQIDFFDS